MTRSFPRDGIECIARRDKCVSLGTAAFRIRRPTAPGPPPPLSIYTVGDRTVASTALVRCEMDGRVFLFPYKFISSSPYLRARVLLWGGECALYMCVCMDGSSGVFICDKGRNLLCDMHRKRVNESDACASQVTLF